MAMIETTKTTRSDGMENKDNLETVYKKVCQVCGASYHGNTSMHTRATGHNDWKRIKEVREKAEMKVFYVR